MVSKTRSNGRWKPDGRPNSLNRRWETPETPAVLRLQVRIRGATGGCRGAGYLSQALPEATRLLSDVDQLPGQAIARHLFRSVRCHICKDLLKHAPTFLSHLHRYFLDTRDGHRRLRRILRQLGHTFGEARLFFWRQLVHFLNEVVGGLYSFRSPRKGLPAVRAGARDDSQLRCKSGAETLTNYLMSQDRCSSDLAVTDWTPRDHFRAVALTELPLSVRRSLSPTRYQVPLQANLSGVVRGHIAFAFRYVASFLSAAIAACTPAFFRTALTFARAPFERGLSAAR